MRWIIAGAALTLRRAIELSSGGGIVIDGVFTLIASRSAPYRSAGTAARETRCSLNTMHANRIFDFSTGVSAKRTIVIALGAPFFVILTAVDDL
jgi:hypothetical protein